MFFRPARAPEPPQNQPEMGAPGPPDIVGLSQEIIGYRHRGGAPVGHPQGVQVKTLILNMKCPTIWAISVGMMTQTLQSRSPQKHVTLTASRDVVDVVIGVPHRAPKT